MHINRFKIFISILLIQLPIKDAVAQYYTEHYIAPKGYTFYNETHRIYISTLDDNVDVRLYNPIDYYNNGNPLEVYHIINGIGVRKSVITINKGIPSEIAIPNRANVSVLGQGGVVNVVRPITPWARSTVNETGVVASGEGLIVISSFPVSVSIANLSGNRFIQQLSDPTINGNSSLTSKGHYALGKKFHLLNYRVLSRLASFPVNYSILATEDNTLVKCDGQEVGTLNKGEYIILNVLNLFTNYNLNLSLGSQITSSKLTTMTISNKNDYPPARAICADAFSDQMIPDRLAGIEYIAIRGKGHTTTQNTTFERVNIVAINDNTTVNINRNGFEHTEVLSANESYITNVGDNNESTGPFTTSYIKSDKPILVIQVSGQGCEQGMTVLPPLSCTGSSHIETKVLPNLSQPNSYYPFDAYVLVKCGTTTPTLNGVTFTNPTSIPGNNSWLLYRFNNSHVQNTSDIIIDNSGSLMHVGMLQNGGLFTAYAYLSGYSKTGIIEIEYETPSNQNIIEEGCSEAKIIFKRVRQCDSQDIKFTFTGTATPDIDYNSPPIQNNGIISFDANEIRKEVPIMALIDNESERDEYINITFELDTDCDGIKEQLTSQLVVKDAVPLSFNSKDYNLNCLDKSCLTAEKSIILESEIIGGSPPFKITWQDGTVEALTKSPFITSLLVSKEQNYPIEGENIYKYRVVDRCGSSLNGQVKLTKTKPPIMSYTTPNDIVGCIDVYCNTDDEIITATAEVMGGTPPYFITMENGIDKVLSASPFQVEMIVNKETFRKKLLAGGENNNVNQYYHFTVVDKCCKVLNGKIKIFNQCGYCVPNVITPNGDGYNDRFVVQNIEQYENTAIIIHNRWGDVVYESDNYKNEWNANGVISSTYYYEIIPDNFSVIPRKDGKLYDRKFKGIINVVR